MTVTKSGLLAALISLVLAACGGGSGRAIEVVQRDDGCEPGVIAVQAGEKVTFEVRNESRKDREFEGIDGTRIEEVLVPSGRTRKINYTVPSSPELQKVKCYVPGGSATVIELRVSGATAGGGGGAPVARPTVDTTNVDARVAVGLGDYTVDPVPASVKAGKILFSARNDSPTEVHELALLRIRDDGSFDNLGEAEDIQPGETVDLVFKLERGRYLLACFIVPGEAGSEVDHFTEGMKTEFVVE